MIKYKFKLSIGLSNCEQEEEVTVDDLGYTEAQWVELEEKAKVDVLQAYCDDWIFEYVEAGFEMMD